MHPSDYVEDEDDREEEEEEDEEDDCPEGRIYVVSTRPGYESSGKRINYGSYTSKSAAFDALDDDESCAVYLTADHNADDRFFWSDMASNRSSGCYLEYVDA